MIAVTGGGGILATYLHEMAPELFSETVSFFGREELDVTNAKGLTEKLDRLEPRLVMHLGAMTDVDKCELEPERAYLVNTIGTENVARWCAGAGVPMVYVSTGGVFGDGDGPFSEFDEPHPRNVYGRSKLLGERAVERLVRDHYIIRAGWLMGGGAKDNKFVAKMVRLLRTETEVLAVDDKFGSPTYSRDLALGIADVVKLMPYGLYHLSNTGMATRYEVAVHIAHSIGSQATVRRATSARFPLPAPRARSEALENLKLRLLGYNRMRSWEDALDAYLMSADWATEG